ncbi:MAG: pentapeptide repeat-containing protein, partial [Bdellovibrionota bacterium]
SSSSFAEGQIEYDPASRACLNAAGMPDQYLSEPKSCGAVRNLKKSKWQRTVKFRKDGSHSLNFRGLRIQKSNLSDSDFKFLDLEGAVFSDSNFENSDFQSANLRDAIFDGSSVDNADFRSADLRGAVFDEDISLTANIHSAQVNERTKFGGAISCDQVKKFELVWSSRWDSPCEGGDYKLADMNADFNKKFPGTFVFQREKKVFVFSSPVAEFRPMGLELVSPGVFGLNSWDFFEILCAAKISNCLKSRRGVASDLWLRRLPSALLKSGIEFYHGRTSEIDNKRLVRFIGFSELVIQDALESKELRNSVAKILKIKPDQIEFLKWSDHLEQISAVFNFLPLGETKSFCEGVRDPKSLDQRIKCRVIIDQRTPEADVEQWLKQLTQGWVRSAQNSTASLSFRLSGQFISVIDAEAREPAQLGFVVPVKNINFWEVLDVARR